MCGSVIRRDPSCVHGRCRNWGLSLGVYGRGAGTQGGTYSYTRQTLRSVFHCLSSCCRGSEWPNQSFLKINHVYLLKKSAAQDPWEKHHVTNEAKDHRFVRFWQWNACCRASFGIFPSKYWTETEPLLEPTLVGCLCGFPLLLCFLFILLLLPEGTKSYNVTHVSATVNISGQ